MTLPDFHALTSQWTPFSVILVVVTVTLCVCAAYSTIKFGTIPQWLIPMISIILGSAGTVTGVRAAISPGKPTQNNPPSF